MYIVSFLILKTNNQSGRITTVTLHIIIDILIGSSSYLYETDVFEYFCFTVEWSSQTAQRKCATRLNYSFINRCHNMKRGRRLLSLSPLLLFLFSSWSNLFLSSGRMPSFVSVTFKKGKRRKLMWSNAENLPALSRGWRSRKRVNRTEERAFMNYGINPLAEQRRDEWREDRAESLRWSLRWEEEDGGVRMASVKGGVVDATLAAPGCDVRCRGGCWARGLVQSLPSIVIGG